MKNATSRVMIVLVLATALAGCANAMFWGAPYHVESSDPDKVVIRYDPTGISAAQVLHNADVSCSLYSRSATLVRTVKSPSATYTATFSCGRRELASTQ